MYTRVIGLSSEESVRKGVWLPSDFDIQVYSEETSSREILVSHFIVMQM